MKHMMLSAGFLAVLGGCNMVQDGTAGENDKYTIGAPGFDQDAFDRRHLEQNMAKLERIGRTDCGAFALELYAPQVFSYSAMRTDTNLESELNLFWVVRVTNQLMGKKLLVTVPAAFDGREWRAERLDENGRWVETEKAPPAGGGKPHNVDARYVFSGNKLDNDIVLAVGLLSPLSGILEYSDVFPAGRYRIHMGQFSAQVEGQELCYFDTTVWEVNIRR